MKNKDSNQEKIEIKVEREKQSKLSILAIIIVGTTITMFGGSILTSKEGKTRNTVKSSLDKVVEKSGFRNGKFYL